MQTDFSSSSNEVFLASIEAKLRSPFSSFTVSKAIERDSNPTRFVENIKHLVFEKAESSAKVDKTLKLRVLISLLGLEENILQKIASSSFQPALNTNILWELLQNAQEEDEEIWVRIIGGYIQGMMYGSLKDSEREAENVSWSQRDLLQKNGREVDNKFAKTNSKIIKETLKAFEKKMKECTNSPLNKRDEIQFYAPTKYQLLEKKILLNHNPSLFENLDFRTTLKMGAHESNNNSSTAKFTENQDGLPSIFLMDLRMEHQRAADEEREMEDHKSMKQRLRQSQHQSNGQFPNAVSDEVVDIESDKKTPMSFNASAIQTAPKRETTSVAQITATSRITENRSAPISSLPLRGGVVGRAMGRRGGMSEAAKAALALKQAKSASLLSRAGASSVNFGSRRIGAGRMAARNSAPNSGKGMKMTILEVADVQAIEKERAQSTKKRGARVRGPGHPTLSDTGRLAISDKSKRRKLSSEVGHTGFFEGLSSTKGSDQDEDVEEDDDEDEEDEKEVSQTEANIIGQFGQFGGDASRITTNRFSNANESFQNPVDLNSFASSLQAEDSSWGLNINETSGADLNQH